MNLGAWLLGAMRLVPWWSSMVKLLDRLQPLCTKGCRGSGPLVR